MLPLDKLKRALPASWVSLSKAVCLTGSLLAATAGVGHAIPDCKRLVFAEYCFEGTIKELFPLDEMEAAFSEEANRLKNLRVAESSRSEKDRDWLEQEWKQATASAYQYARNHTLRLDNVLDPSAFPVNGTDPLNLMSRLLSKGPLFRLTFSRDENGVFRLSSPTELNRKRLVAVLRDMSNQLPRSGRLAAQSAQIVLAGFPGGDFVPVRKIFDHPVVKNFLLLSVTKGKPLTEAHKDLLGKMGAGIFGVEAVMVFYIQFDLRLLERNEELVPTVHLFHNDGQGEGENDVSSPMVTFNGELLMPDSVFEDFTKDEIRLILQHEATHLAKPSLFTVFSAADAVVGTRFPDIRPDLITTYLSNFFGRSNPDIASTNCPLALPEDDEMFTDYYVLAQYRNDPERMDAYEALLEKLHEMRGFGSLSRMAFRLKHLKIARQELEEMKRGSVSEERYNALVSQVVQSVAEKTILSGKTAEQLRFDDFLDEMMKYPELELDAKRIRILVQYYKAFGHLKDDQVAQNSTLGLNCEALGKMLRLPGRR